MCKRITTFAIVAIALFICIPSFAQHFLGAFSGAALQVDTQIENPPQNNNAQTLSEQKAGDTIQFQLFVPAGGGQATNGYTVELDLLGKTFSNSIGTVSGRDWTGTALTSTGSATLSALLLTGGTVPSTGYLGQIDLQVTQPLEAGATLIVKSLVMTSGSDLDPLDVSNAIISFTAPSACLGDFDGNGRVNIADFRTFVNVFGSSSSNANYNAQMDFDSNGSVNLADFLAFVNVFGTECEGTPPSVVNAAVKMYWGDGGKIQRSNLDGSNIENLVTGVNAWGIVLDVAARKMYWTDGGSKIQRANLDGSNIQDLVTGLSSPQPIALDIAAGMMYWGANNKIQRANLDGSNVQDLVTGLNNPDGIALDIAAGMMYWQDWNTGKIQRANLDGSNVQDLVTGLNNPDGIALDIAAGMMYWTEDGKIRRANLNGSNIQDLVTGLSRPWGIALDVVGGKMYWTDSSTGKIQRANLNGTNAEDLVTGLSSPIGIALDISGGASGNGGNGGSSGTTTRLAFEASTPAGYTAVNLKDNGTVWGVPTQYTDDSDIGTVAYMLLAKLKGCSFANAEADRGSKVYIKTQALGSLPSFVSESVCRKTSSSYGSWPRGVRITHLRFFDASSPTNIREAVYNTSTGQYSVVEMERDVPPSDGDSTPVSIPDTNLRAVIADSLGKASGEAITAAEMATLTRLDAPNKDIRNLTGLESATNLTWLDLGTARVDGEFVNSNSISDLSPLSGLTNLTRLDLVANSISDVSALSNLTSLEWLSLYNNSILDVSALSNLTSLEWLSLSTNSISDVSPLSGLTNLESLWLQHNNISDSSALSGLTNLIRLSLGNNSISDVSPLSGLTSLESLFLYNNSISDVSALSNLTNLTGLDLGDMRVDGEFVNSNSISDLSPLSGLTNLESLDLGDNSVSDVSPLSGLTNLTRLDLSTNSISDVSPLSGLTSLESLSLRTNSISDVSPLSSLTNLEWLSLIGNNISDVSALSSLINLEWLTISYNSISDVSALSNLTNLETLWLRSNNNISDISALSGLTSLEWLTLDNNNISDISPLSGLTSLRLLYLGNNSISNLAPLVANTGLSSGDRVDVQRNPLSATSINTHIPALQARGVEVRFSSSKPTVGENDDLRDMPVSSREEALDRAEWEREMRGKIFEQ